MNQRVRMNHHWRRVIIGGLGGLAAVAAKFIAQDHPMLEQLSVDGKLPMLAVTYCTLTPILIFLGGLVAWASNEVQPMKLLAMGIAAPAMITTLAGGARTLPTASTAKDAKKAELHFQLSPIGTAHAAEPGAVWAQASLQRADVSPLREGFELFFGVQRYWVIVGSYKDKNEAGAKAAAINKEDPSLKAFVGLRQPNNEFYPVIVGDYLPLAEANRLRDRAVALKSIDEAYLSTYRDRRPPT